MQIRVVYSYRVGQPCPPICPRSICVERCGQFGGTLRGLSTFRLTFVYGIRTEKVPESWNGGMFKDCEQVLSVPTRPRVERYQAPGISSVNIMNAVLEFAGMCSKLTDQLVSILQRRRSEVDAGKRSSLGHESKP